MLESLYKKIESKNAEQHLPKILSLLEERGFVLMLDYDGTLSPIVADPKKARISPDALASLQILASRVPVAIISGRSLSDIQQRVPIPNISYAGSHGLEASIHGESGSRKLILNKEQKHSLEEAKNQLRAVGQRYSGILIEEKDFGITLNYRSLAGSGVERRFRTEALKTVASYVKTRAVRIVDSLYSFELLPDVAYTKGDCSQDIFDAVKGGENAVAVYIGDSKTDEDAFRVLSGVTIRVGKGANTAATYFFEDRAQVDEFLKKLVALCPQPNMTVRRGSV